MKSLKIFAIAIFALLCAAKQGRADITLTFDNLTGTQLAIPQGYGNLHWINFYYLNGTTQIPSGYNNAVISPDNVAFNMFGEPASFNSIAKFTLLSAYFTSAWNDGMEMTALGFLAGNPTPVVTQNFRLDTSGSQLITFNNFSGLNEAWFIPNDGTPHGFQGVGEQFAMDNVTLASSVPEPAAVFLFGTALLGVVSVLRRRVA